MLPVSTRNSIAFSIRKKIFLSDIFPLSNSSSSGSNLIPGILVLISSYTLARGNIGAAKKLHCNLLANKLHTPQSFFDTTPIGRVLNRFSKDIYVIDEALPATVLMFLSTFFVSLSTMIVIISTTPIFAVVIAPLAFIYVFVQVLYKQSSWENVAHVPDDPLYTSFLCKHANM